MFVPSKEINTTNEVALTRSMMHGWVVVPIETKLPVIAEDATLKAVKGTFLMFRL
jgi:hypothetical protein